MTPLWLYLAIVKTWLYKAFRAVYAWIQWAWSELVATVKDIPEFIEEIKAERKLRDMIGTKGHASRRLRTVLGKPGDADTDEFERIKRTGGFKGRFR